MDMRNELPYASFIGLTSSPIEKPDKQMIKSHWVRLEAIVVNEHRKELMAKDIVKLFEQRKENENSFASEL